MCDLEKYYLVLEINKGMLSYHKQKRRLGNGLAPGEQQERKWRRAGPPWEGHVPSNGVTGCFFLSFSFFVFIMERGLVFEVR